MNLKSWPIVALTATLTACSVAIAQLVITPPVSDVNINGHTYTNAQLQANPTGWIGGIANDIGAVTSQYPTGRFNPRTQLTSDLTFFVDPAAGNDTRTCLVGQPCQTIQHVLDVLRDQYDLAGFIVTVQLANGNYSPGWKIRGRLVGQQSPGSLVIKGNSGSPSSVVVSDTTVPTNAFETGTGTPAYSNWGAMVTYDGMRLIGGYRDLWANSFSEVRIQNLQFGDSGVTPVHMAATNNGIIKVRGNYSIAGNAIRAHWLASDGGEVNGSDTSVPEIMPLITLVGNPSIGTFAECNKAGRITSVSSQTSFSGTMTGVRSKADNLCMIFTQGSGLTYFPGTINASAPTNGAITN